jgi:TorA maturation chaperone TorD
MLLYFAGSNIMHEPTEECIADFLKNGILKNLPVSSSNPNFILAASMLRNSLADNSFDEKLIQNDYVRLFAGDKHSLAPGYESFYKMKRDPNIVRSNNSVTEFYDSYGWVSKFKGIIEDDNLGVELLFLTRLIDEYLVLEDDLCQTEMRREIRRFIYYHLLSWITEWNREVQIHSHTFYFKGIGTLILACTEDIFNLLAQSQVKSIKERNLRN